MKHFCLYFAFIMLPYCCSKAQYVPNLSDTLSILLNNMGVQIEATSAVDLMYNFEFEKSRKQFNWFKAKYPEHPLPYFLVSLSYWWQIQPNVENEQYDELFEHYLDTTILFAKKMFDKQGDIKVEGAFFLAGAYGFKARLAGERKAWIKAAFAAKSCFNYLEYSKNKENLSTEFLFGQALYNYYSVWIKENYKRLRFIMRFFTIGTKQEGIEQLETVVQNAFYTRTEAIFYLIKIYYSEGNVKEVLRYAKLLHTNYPNNPVFQRYYANALYLNHTHSSELQSIAADMVCRYEEGHLGYTHNIARYAAFFLANTYRYNKYSNYSNKKNYIFYLESCVEYAKKADKEESNYTVHAYRQLANYYVQQLQIEKARKVYERIMRVTNKKSLDYKNAKAFLAKSKN